MIEEGAGGRGGCQVEGTHGALTAASPSNQDVHQRHPPSRLMPFERELKERRGRGMGQKVRCSTAHTQRPALPAFSADRPARHTLERTHFGLSSPALRMRVFRRESW